MYVQTEPGGTVPACFLPAGRELLLEEPLPPLQVLSLGQPGPAAPPVCPGPEATTAAKMWVFGKSTQSPASPCSLHSSLSNQAGYVKAEHNLVLPWELFIELKPE